MLLNRQMLAGIAEGRITLAFRRWLRPTVKKGSRLRTEIGELAIEAVDSINESAVTDAAACRAGYDNRQELLSRRSPGRRSHALSHQA
jgi:hypothetical protein